MSRIAKNPIELPSGVECQLDGRRVRIKGPNGAMEMELHPAVELEQDGSTLRVTTGRPDAMALAGTMRALVNNLVEGVTRGFEKRLNLVGIGYRAQVQGQKLNLQLGFSHPIEFPIPDGITLETPSQSEIVIKGSDKQLVGEVAAKIRAYRPPEPYKGKGVRYAGERVVMKETKKA